MREAGLKLISGEDLCADEIGAVAFIAAAFRKEAKGRGM